MKAVLAFILMLVVVPLHHAPVPPIPKMPAKAPTVVKKATHTDLQCLASAIYHEARGEPLEGQRAVYEVIMHRAKVLRKSLCAVVKAPAQFSWYGEPDKPILPYGKQMRELIVKVKSHPKTLEDSAWRWFFGSHIRPKWSFKMECRMIGNHMFCKEKQDGEVLPYSPFQRNPGVPETERRDERGLES